MKKIFALLLLLCMLTLMFSSCSIYPSLEEWHIWFVQYEQTYINGYKSSVTVRTHPWENCPMAVHQGMTYIKSRWDGKLIFKPIDSDEELVGTYKHYLNGSITIYFDNGEQTERGRSSFYYTIAAENPEYEGSFNFTFRGVSYYFSTQSSRSHTPEEHEIAMKEFAIEIRNGDHNLNQGKISGQTLISNVYQFKNVDLFEDKTKLRVIQITSDNRVVELDELKDGECYFYGYNQGPISSFVIYYID